MAEILLKILRRGSTISPRKKEITEPCYSQDYFHNFSEPQISNKKFKLQFYPTNP